MFWGAHLRRPSPEWPLGSSCFDLFILYGVCISSLTLCSYINQDSDNYNNNHDDFDLYICHNHQYDDDRDYNYDRYRNDKHNDHGHRDNKHDGY